MLTCENCGAKQMVGTIFCAECGATLIPEHRPTNVFAYSAPRQSPSAPRPNPAKTPTPSAAPKVTLLVVASGRRVQVSIEDEVLIGRKDEARGIFPEIDLSVEGGYDAGVSRRHAIILRRGDAYHIEDLGSANGTFVNGRQLAPQVPTVIADGDELKCAMLVMRVALHREAV